MQTSAELRSQIKQVENEVQDITRSLDKLSRTQDLLDAHQELKNRADVLVLLRQRLETTRAKEEQQAKLDARAELERTRDDAKAEHDRLDADFEAVMLPLEEHILDVLDDLDRIALQRSRVSARHSQAFYELRGRVDDFGRSDLSTSFGWYSASSPDAHSDVRVCLRELYSARHGMPGRLKLDGQDRGLVPLVAREPVKAEPDPDAFRAQVVAEYTAKNG